MHPITFRLVLLVLTVLSVHFSFGQGVTPTKGKDFWLGFLKNFETDPAESLDLFIVSDQNTTGTVTVPGQSWSQTFTVTANSTTTVSIPNNIAEVYDANIIQGKGVHIETADTVAVFAISFNPYTADGTKVLPTPTLGTNYMVATYAGLSPWDSEAMIVATEDGTEIQITPSVALLGGQGAGVPFTVQLDQGEVYMIVSSAGLDLTGTLITATEESGSCRPFAVFSGAGCTNLPNNCIACDHIYEENFPIELWGFEYYITPYVFELNPGYSVTAPNYTYRILASENNTSISIDGGTAFILDAGEFMEYNYEEDAHCIIADKKIAVIEYMEGISCGGNGDPAMLILDDATKKIDNITFSTVESTVITSHYLNVIIEVGDIGNVTLDGVTIDAGLFQNFTSCGSHVWAGFEITEGSHTLDAPGGGVTAYVYGNGDAESYAYSVGSFSPIPPIEIDEALCSNDEVVLQILGNYSDPYWYNYTAPEDTLAEGYTYTITPPITNGIYVGVGNEFTSGCEEEFYFSVEVPEPPVLQVTPNGVANICQYESIQLNAQAFPTSAVYYYSWSPTAGLSNPNIANPIATPLVSTTYTCTVTTPSGCGTNSASIDIIVAGGNITDYSSSPEEALFCIGDAIDMNIEVEELVWEDDFDPGVSWGVWAAINNGTANSTCGSVLGNGLYFNGTGDRSATTNPMNCTNGGNVYFSLKIANGVAPCDNAEPGDNVVLEYSTNGVSYTVMNTYFESGYPDFVNVVVPIPVPAQTATTRFRWRQLGSFVNNQDNWVLDNCYIGIENSADFDFTWSPAAGLSSTTAQSPSAAPTESTMYYVETTDPLSGCEYVDSVFVDVGQPFVLTMSPDTTLCDVQGIEISATPDFGDPDDYDYTWTPGTNMVGGLTNSPVVTPNATTTYQVVATSAQGCTAEGEVEIIVGELLDLTVNASDLSICAGEVINLTASLAGNPQNILYEWSPAAGVTDINDPITTVSPFVNTTYVMTVTHEPSGCQLSEDVSITVLQAFTIDAQPDAVELCVTNGLEITTTNTFNGPLTWTWTPAALLSSTNTANTTMIDDASAELIITATNNAGCSSKDTVFVTLLIETTDLGPDLGICEDETVTFDTGWPADYTIEWSNGETTPSITVNEPNVYLVQVTSPLGCYSEDEVELTVYTYPEIDLGADTALCEGETLDLLAGPPELNYLWSTGETTPQITVSESGVYELNVDNGFCFISDMIGVVFNPMPVDPFLSDEVEFCFDNPPFVFELDALNPGYTFEWSTGATSQAILAETDGYYTVLITSPFGCASSYGITIDQVCPAFLWIPNAFSPDNDGINDVWMVDGQNILSFNVKIWNRWGELFFESDDINKPWLGQRRDGDTYVENGVYVYKVVVTMRGEDGKVSEEVEFNGHITMIR